MQKHHLVEERLTYSVIGAFYEVYSQLGFGFYETIYANALEHELKSRGHNVAREVSFQIAYKGHVLGIQRLDMMVDEKLVVETKASEDFHKSAFRQVQSYLRAANLRVGLLFHFGPQPRFYRFLSPLRVSPQLPPSLPNPNSSCP
jgi:GxxExxY protein